MAAAYSNCGRINVCYLSHFCYLCLYVTLNEDQDPVVQNIVSLTKSLVNDSLSLLVRLKSSVLIFFAEKMRGAFALLVLVPFFCFSRVMKWELSV